MYQICVFLFWTTLSHLDIDNVCKNNVYIDFIGIHFRESNYKQKDVEWGVLIKDNLSEKLGPMEVRSGSLDGIPT